MAEYQRGRRLSERQVEDVVTWLEALTGDIPVDYIKEPRLPKSTATTPKPETGD
jgi:cytochrome c peroxidase